MNKPTYLKKSFLQYNFPSREKHFSDKVHLQSQHWTHLTCHGLSKTLSRNLSRMGFSQLVHWSMLPGDTPKPVGGSDTLFFFSEIFVPPASRSPGCWGSKESKRPEQLHHHPWGIALLFCSTQVNNPHMTNGSKRQTKQHLWSSLICRSRLGLRRSEVGAQFKGKSCVFRRREGSRLEPEVKTNKGKTRSQRLRSFSFVSNFAVTSSRGWEKACNERTSWRSAYCILRKPWRQGQENLWAVLLISMKRRVCTKEKRKENSKIQLELLKNEKATKIRTRWKIRIFADENWWITP